MAGLTVAQISEFSIILITILLTGGYFDYVNSLGLFYNAQDILLLVTTVGLITITGSSYLIIYADKIYPFFEKPLSFFEKRNKSKLKLKKKRINNMIVLFLDVIELDMIFYEHLKKQKQVTL